LYKKLLTIFFLFAFVVCLDAYELPKVGINDNRPEVVVFKAESVVVKDKALYELKWKTINATDVQLTFIGKVKTSGSITITKDEYNRGPITLTASSRESSFSDSKTLNMKKSNEPPFIMIKSQNQKVQSSYYNTMPYPRRTNRAYRNRNIRRNNY